MAATLDNNGPWWRELTRYHWFVFLVAALGWLFDTMDQQLFALARDDAISELLRLPASDPLVREYSGHATAIFLIGWASGGLFFGVLGDRIGRVRTMLMTILIYSIFTGLSVFSKGFVDFAAYRFFTGLGVGGEFAVGVALIAETIPARARPYTLSLLQASSAAGNILAAMIYLGLGTAETYGWFAKTAGATTPWRIAFLIGTAPALLVLLIRRRLKEPERWQAVAGAPVRRGSYRELFGDPRWRRHALLGTILGFAGVVGLWGIGFFSIQLQKAVFRKTFEAEGLVGDDLEGRIKQWAGITSAMLNVGACFGMVAFGVLTQRVGRRWAFAASYLSAMFSTAAVFWYFDSRTQVFWMIPLMGFCLLSIFGGLAVYFPELFPTRLRSTGTSFCYNVGRFVAAGGPYVFGILTSQVFVGLPREPMRYAGASMCVIFLLGVAVLPFLPETKDQPLPE